MHDFFTVRERYKHALFSVSCIVQVLEHLVTLSYIGVPVTINKHDNAVVHGISSKRVTSKGVKFEFSDYRVSMSFIIHVLDPQTFVGNQETLFHHERRQSPDVMLVAELFTFCREVFFGCLFCLFLQEFPTFCFTLRIIRGGERNVETGFLETIFYKSSDGPCSVRSHIVPVLSDKSNHR